MTLRCDQFPRLLAGFPPDGAMSLQTHEALHGQLPLPAARNRRPVRDLISELERSGLRGFGGAEFPTATKMNAVAAQHTRTSVVVNAAEGEPLSEKDKVLLQNLPHLVIDGAVMAAALLNSDRIVMALDEAAEAEALALRQAVAERRGRRSAALLDVVLIPGGYLSGQESALLNAISGRGAKPSVTPPFPYQRGLGGRPTLVSNAETFAQVGLIARHGSDWYRAIGTESSPGSRLITVSGAVSSPGVVEVTGATTIGEALDAVGGTSEELQGILVGGYAGTWLGPEDVSLRLDKTSLRTRGASLGAGIVFALPQTTCVVAEVARVTRWLQQESAKQCGPCIRGLGAIANALEELTAGQPRSDAYEHIERWCSLVLDRGACRLPDGAVSFISSAIHTFSSSFEDHARHGPCAACFSAGWLPTPGPEAVAHA